MQARSGGVVALALSALSVAACVETPEAPTTIGAQAVAVPAQGTATTLDFGSWNVEWFGDTANGPTNEPLQAANVHDVLLGADLDVWGLEEVVSTAQINSVVAGMPGYAVLIANDPSVVNGPQFYSDFGNLEQKVGLLYKTAVATVLGAQVILTQFNTDFAGRPPLEVKLRVTLNGTTEDVVVIVQHPKCCSDSASWQRRVNASNALKAYVDATWPTQKVWVIGDWNDDVDTSITTGSASPYANFVNDPARYTVVTKALSDAHIASTTGFPDTIDHHMGTNEVAATLVPGSVQVFRADAYVASYGTTTSDHYPVMSRYSFGGGTATPTVTVTAPNGGEQVVVGSAQTIRWSSSAVTDVRVELSTDGGATFSTIAASTPAAAGSLAWTVPATPSTAALIRVSDTASAATDRSDAAFAIVAAGGTANVVINEILANEPGSTTAGEFVELVNIGTAPADLSGWTLSDASAVRHTFPAGTTLAAGKAIVVFGGASGIPAGTPGAVAASTGSLSLGNSGDSVILKSGTTVISSFTYGSALAAQDGVSMNRSPDGGTAATYVLHNTLTALKASPGTRASGAAW